MKTAAISDSPTIGIVASHQAVAQLVVRALTKPGVSIQTTDASKLGYGDWYKLVWFVDSTEAEARSTADVLSQVNSNIVVIFPIVSPALTNLGSADSLWPTFHLAERRLLALLMEKLPTAVFVLVFNLILPSPAPALTTDLDWLIKPLELGVLLDPNLSLGLSSWPEVGNVISQLVSRPHTPQTILLSPPKMASHGIMAAIQAASLKQNGEHPDVLSHPVTLDSSYPPTTETRALTTPVRKILYDYLNQIELPCALVKPGIPSPTLQPQTDQASSAKAMVVENVAQAQSPIVYTEHPFYPDSTTQPPSSVLPDFSLSQSLSSIFTQTNNLQKQTYLTQITKTEVQEGHRSSRRKRLFIFGSLSIGIATSAIVLFSLFTLNLSLVKKSLIMPLVSLTSTSNTEFKPNQLLVKSLDSQAKIYDLLISNPKLDEARATVGAISLWQRAQAEAQVAQEAGQKLVGSLLGINDAEIESSAQNVSLHSRSAYEYWSQLQTEMGQIDLSDKNNTADSTKLQTTMDERLKDFHKLEKVIPIISKLAATNKMTLAVFFQNGQELRPTGGFLQAVGLLNFDHGRLVAHSTYSSYSLDNKIVGKVTAPDDIKANLGESNLYFRDSNWDPNFPTSMQKSGWFLDKALGKPIDGAIALNTSALPALLAAIGPVDLPTYNEVITSANVAERLEFHSEVQLTPGSTDYTTTLLEGILTNLSALKPEKYSSLTTALANILDEQGILIAFNDKDLQKNIAELGWSGAILTPPCPTQFDSANCQADTLAQVETNVGVNKANYYLDTNLTHNVSLSRTMAVHERTVHYTNTAKSNAWPRGPYKAYVRVYVPENATKIEVNFNKIQLIGPSLKLYPEYAKQVLAFSIEVPVNTTRDLVIRYSTPLNVKANEKLSYVLFDQKQPGTEAIPVKTTIELSPDLSPTLIAPQAEVIDKKIIFHATSKTHLLYGVLAN